jgi:hypothetical protein
VINYVSATTQLSQPASGRSIEIYHEQRMSLRTPRTAAASDILLVSFCQCPWPDLRACNPGPPVLVLTISLTCKLPLDQYCFPVLDLELSTLPPRQLKIHRISSSPPFLPPSLVPAICKRTAGRTQPLRPMEN